MQNDILNEIYDAYKGKIEEASSMWKSNYCCSQKEKDNRDREDTEDLKYFKELIDKISSLGLINPISTEELKEALNNAK